MDAEAIRAEAIERLAKAQYWYAEYMSLPNDPPPDFWERATEAERAHWREGVVSLVEALGDLLPTAQESRYIGRGMLRRTRFVCGWKEPEE